MTKFHEVNFDGLVGPTHNYAGLAFGNVASEKNAKVISNPKAAALQGLEKMRLLHDLGVKQAVLPPQERPSFSLLNSLGFKGKIEDILHKAYQEAPEIFSASYSASSMWAANIATISPSLDCLDERVHITPANLCSNLHRLIETQFSSLVLSKVFADPNYFVMHRALPNVPTLGDEGAANHVRLCKNHNTKGVEIFVYGQKAWHLGAKPEKYPARQTCEASQSIIRKHNLDPKYTLLLQQNPKAIDLGAFHNDVVSVGNENVFLYHEQAYLDEGASISSIKKACENFNLHLLGISDKELSLGDAIKSYLFNSQIVTLNKKGSASSNKDSKHEMALIAPEECTEIKDAKKVIDRIISEDNPVTELHYVNCHQSMKNGGGPACLRLRVLLSVSELKSIHQGVMFNTKLYTELKSWIEKHYRDRLSTDDLCDPKLIEESYMALDKLTDILKLGKIYSFQN
tara:strand:+ start:2953 stop:4323 length:1371 start_codon:yes stop_codon:yes gene_type:complete